MNAPDYGSPTFAAWRAACPDVWQAYTRHPFVRGLEDGSLPKSAFVHYLIQDYVFLIHFGRSWALAVVKSQTLDEMKLAASVVDGLINHEMRLHVEVCAREGISEDQLYAAEEEMENLAYTRYVMDAGQSGDFLDMMAALAPCCFGYGEIGARLGQSASADTTYREWIDTYADAEYQGLCDSIGDLIEKATTARLGPNPQSNPRWNALSGLPWRPGLKLAFGIWGCVARNEIRCARAVGRRYVRPGRRQPSVQPQPHCGSRRMDVFVGAVGCSKSTLLRILAGLSTGGTFEGKMSASDGQPIRSRIAYMAQRI